MTTVCGLTILFEMMSIGWSTDGWDFIVIMRRFGDVVPKMPLSVDPYLQVLLSQILVGLTILICN